jgi:hypothetical protein
MHREMMAEFLGPAQELVLRHLGGDFARLAGVVQCPPRLAEVVVLLEESGPTRGFSQRGGFSNGAACVDPLEPVLTIISMVSAMRL